MGDAKALLSRIPILRSLYRLWFNRQARRHFRSMSVKDVFETIYRRDAWSSAQSLSGTGSETDQTNRIVQELPGLLKRFNITSMLDAPCGDFHWMKDVDLTGIDYTGADIIDELVDGLEADVARDGIHFRNLDLTHDRLPTVDLVLCRDCLVHFSFEDVMSALRNICRSESTYLLTTTFTAHQPNRDIVTGQWRTLNLQAEPFSFAEPLALLDEGCTEAGGSYADKALGLWRIEDIATWLPKT